MRSGLTLLALSALTSIGAAQSVTRFEPLEFPFATGDPDSFGVLFAGLALSGDGSTIYGSFQDAVLDDQSPDGVRRLLVPWRWRADSGYERLDLTGAAASPLFASFHSVTHDGEHALFRTAGPFGATTGVWTPSGPTSGYAWSDGELGSVTGRPLSAISGDGTTALEPGIGSSVFQTWSEAGGLRTVREDFAGLDSSGVLLSHNGQRVGGASYAIDTRRSAIWIHDPEAGYVGYEDRDASFEIAHINADGTALAGVRNDEIAPFRSEAFVWDAEAGYRTLTPENVSNGFFITASGDASLIVHLNTGAPGGDEARLFSTMLGDLPLLDGLSQLGFDVSGLQQNEFNPIAFSDDGRTLLGYDTSTSGPLVPVLLTASIPTPGAVSLLMAVPMVIGVRRRTRTSNSRHHPVQPPALGARFARIECA